MSDPATAGAVIGGINLAATNAWHARAKYKNTPLVLDAVTFAEKNLQETIEKSARHRREFNSQFRKESDDSNASLERREQEGRDVLRSERKNIQKAHTLKSKIDTKEGTWIGRMGSRLAYDQFDARTTVGRVNEAASRIDKRHLEQDKRVSGRDRQRKEDSRNSRKQRASRKFEAWDAGQMSSTRYTMSGLPSLDGEATTIDEFDYEDGCHNGNENDYDMRQQAHYTSGYGDYYDEDQHNIPIHCRDEWAPANEEMEAYRVRAVNDLWDAARGHGKRSRRRRTDDH